VLLESATYSLTLTGTMLDDFFQPSTSTKTTKGGAKRSRTSGSYYTISEQVRITGAELLTLNRMIASNEVISYTPSKIPDYLASGDFPMEIETPRLRKRDRVGGTTIRYMVTIDFTSRVYV